MSRAARGAAVARRVRNAPLAAGVGWRHLGRDPVGSLSVALRALPPGLRARAAARAARRPGPDGATVLGVLALAAAGDRQGALERLAAGAARARGARLHGLVAAAVALHAPGHARDALAALPEQDPARPRLEALVAAEAGRLTEAAGAAARGGRRTRRLHRRLAGELAVLRDAPVGAAGGPPGSTCSREGSPVPGVAGRVLHLVTNALPEVTAGYTTRTHGIAVAQRGAGLDPHVATRLGYPVTAGHLAADPLVDVDGVAYHRLLPLRPLPTTADRLLERDVDLTGRLVARLRPAVLHAHSNHLNGRVALAVGRRAGLPVVYEVRGFLEETWRSRGNDPDSDTYRLARAAETAVMDAADAVVTLSDGMAADIVSRGVPAAKVTVVPNSVSDRFLAPPPDPGPLRAALGIDPGEVVLGTVTTLNDYEGVDVLVDAAAVLAGGGARVRLLLVGDGPAAVALREQAGRVLGDAAVLTGRVPFADVGCYHAAIDVFCVPRLDRPVCRMVTPLKPLEAMATGRPVVGSDLPPLREIVDPGRTGDLATPGDAVALAERLRPLIYDRGARTRMGSEARAWVSAHRTWAGVARTYRDLYAGLGVAAPRR